LDRIDSSSSQSPGSRFLTPAAIALGSKNREPEFSFAGFRLEADGTLLRGKDMVHLPPKELAALRFLLAHPGQIVTPVQLREAIWGDVHVTADSVPKCVSSLRARLEPEECIQTIYKRGYRLAAEVHPAQQAQSGVPVGALPKLAILPFATEFGIPEYLGPSVAEEAIARLSNAVNPAVIVLARDSVFTLALRRLTAQQIGETLKADLVLTGTLRALPSQFRLRAEIIRVEDGAQIYVEDLLVDRSRVAGLESELVDRLVIRLGNSVPAVRRRQEPVRAESNRNELASSNGRDTAGLSIAASTPAAEIESPPSNREAYEIYQQGRYEWQSLQRHRMQDGLSHLNRAAELDPSLIAAKVDLVNLCVTQAFFGFMAPNVAADIVRRTADSSSQVPVRRRRRDDKVPAATVLGSWSHNSGSPARVHRRRVDEPESNTPHPSEAILPALAWINFHVDRNLPAALWAFSRSSHLPHDQWITRVRAMFALSRHRFSEAIALLRAALQQDPYAPWLHARLAWALHLDGQADESVRQIHHALSLFPEHESAALYGSMILAFNGDTGRAAELAQSLVKLSPYFDLASAGHAYALACSGRKSEANADLERLQWMSRERFVLNSFNAAVHVALGDLDAAIAELRTANTIKCPWFFQMLADPRLKPLHGHPEFIEMQSILTQMEAAVQKQESPA
jgi:DNA-binding winged helix-turn-helix (wHTH) protein/tetratricopeptide (TPR) repeat protein